MEAGTIEIEANGEEMVKITREIIIESMGGCITIKPNETVYLHTPNELVEALRERCNIDMRRDKKRLCVKCQMVEERTIGSDDSDVLFLFRVQKLKGGVPC